MSLRKTCVPDRLESILVKRYAASFTYLSRYRPQARLLVLGRGPARATQGRCRLENELGSWGWPLSLVHLV